MTGEINEQQPKDQSPKLNPLTKWGLIGTAAWLGGQLIYFVSVFDLVLSMTPNEVGDYLAGAFAPLAFLWLVLGFFQQGEELRNSARALHLQGEELKNSVEQQRQLVEATREQISLDREALSHEREELARSSAPLFQLVQQSRSSSEGAWSVSYRLTNHGERCTDVRLSFEGREGGAQWAAIDTGHTEGFKLSLPNGQERAFFAVLDYIDGRRMRGRRRFLIEWRDNQSNIVAESNA